MENILFIGGGSWGAALAFALSKNKMPSTIWHRNNSIVESMNKSRNHYLMPSLKIPSEVNFVHDVKTSLKKANIVIISIPSQSVRKFLQRNGCFFSKDKTIVIVSKGIENDSLMTMSQVVIDVLGKGFKRLVTLSGPSHAEEVIRMYPTTLVSASKSANSSKKIQSIFSNNFIRIYSNNDVLGVELGGAIKNVIAIASGICDGIGYGDNTKAALLTRGISEISNLGLLMGAKASTFQGLSGIGDLMVTALSKHSRNRQVGEKIGKGNTLKDIMIEMDMVAEGVKSSLSVENLRKKFKIEMPICNAVYNVLFNQKDPKKAVYDLMNRKLKVEK